MAQALRNIASKLGKKASPALAKLKWDKNPKIGWWKDHDHYTMYHGTHHSNLAHIEKHGLKAPTQGPTAGNVSMTHDPHTAHGYASMRGGESNFRGAGQKAQHVPHGERRVLVAHIPKEWAHKHMNQHFRGNVNNVADNLTNRAKYDAHAKSGKADHQYYATTELRFKKAIPRKFIAGYTQRD